MMWRPCKIFAQLKGKHLLIVKFFEASCARNPRQYYKADPGYKDRNRKEKSSRVVDEN